MLYLSLAILFSSFINWLFRKLSNIKVDVFKVIIINYLTCSIIGQILGQTFLFTPAHISENYFWFCLALGTLFIAIFFCMGKTTAIYGIAVNAVSAKMGLIFPALFFFIYLKESLSVYHWIGLSLALIAVLLINYSSKKIVSKKIIFPILVFVGSGVIDTCIKWIDLTFLKGNSPLMATTTIFTGALIVGIIILTIKKDWNFNRLTFFAGVALGIPNFFSIYFLLSAVQTLSSSNTGSIFAVNNVAVILVSTLGGLIIFKDQLNKIQWLGLAMSILTIYIMTNAF